MYEFDPFNVIQPTYRFIADWLTGLTPDQRWYAAIFVMVYLCFRQLRHINRKLGRNQLNPYNQWLLRRPPVQRVWAFAHARRMAPSQFHTAARDVTNRYDRPRAATTQYESTHAARHEYNSSGSGAMGDQLDREL